MRPTIEAMVDHTYPPDWEFDSLLTDGTEVLVRPIRPDDADALVDFHAGLSPQTIHRRFFSGHPRLLPKEAAFFANVDYCDRVALVAVVDGRLVGVGRYDRSGEHSAEVAFVVNDDFQNHGIGTLLLERLAEAARANGITAFEADTLLENRPMLRVFRDVGSDVHTEWDDGTVHVTFTVDDRRDPAVVPSIPAPSSSSLSSSPSSPS
jgi:GNAT superfamily N-acetyltransferase